ERSHPSGSRGPGHGRGDAVRRARLRAAGHHRDHQRSAGEPGGGHPQHGGSGRAGNAAGLVHPQAGAARFGARARVHQLGSRVPREHRVPGQLQRLQHLGRRQPRAPGGAEHRGVRHRPGRPVDLRQPALHLRRVAPLADRLRDAARRGRQGPHARRPHLRREQPARSEADQERADVPRLAYAHHRAAPDGPGRDLHLRRRVGQCARFGGGAGARVLHGHGGREPEHGGLPGRHHPRAAAQPGAGGGRRLRAHLPEPAAPAGPRRRGPERHRHRPRRDRPLGVPRPDLVPGLPPGRRLVRQLRHPAGRAEPGAAGGAGRQVGSQLLALAHRRVQQRREARGVHGRVGWRHGPALPRHRPVPARRQHRAHHRRREDDAARLLQDAGCADEHGELRVAQRRADPRAGARHHGAGVVPGRGGRVRLHRPPASRRDRLLRPRAGGRADAGDGRLVGRVLLERVHLLVRALARAGHPGAGAGRAPVAQRDRGGEARPHGRVQPAGAAADHLAGRLPGRPLVPRPARAQPRAPRRADLRDRLRPHPRRARARQRPARSAQRPRRPARPGR
ncbi:MAG: putative secreted protein, partial [uncultured Gemmatimonadetes bacterium]